jgi:predicted Fe-Mo cluster-binding NifX family protein
MRIAVASDDRKTISHHFGRALGFKIFVMEDNRIINQEYRKNIGKSTGECGSCNHDVMINNIRDCDVLISYGMGRRIYDDLTKNNIQAVVTDEETVDAAVKRFIKKELENRTDKLH